MELTLTQQVTKKLILDRVLWLDNPSDPGCEVKRQGNDWLVYNRDMKMVGKVNQSGVIVEGDEAEVCAALYWTDENFWK